MIPTQYILVWLQTGVFDNLVSAVNLMKWTLCLLFLILAPPYDDFTNRRMLDSYQAFPPNLGPQYLTQKTDQGPQSDLKFWHD